MNQENFYGTSSMPFFNVAGRFSSHTSCLFFPHTGILESIKNLFVQGSYYFQHRL